MLRWFIKRNHVFDAKSEVAKNIGMELKRGWGNGYVVIPPIHPWHNKDYNDIDVEVHGGLTFGEPYETLSWPELTEADKGHWIIGFDTCHYSDTKERWPKEAVREETKILMKQVQFHTGTKYYLIE